MLCVRAAEASVTFFDSKSSFDLTVTSEIIETFDAFSPVDTRVSSPIIRGMATFSALAPSTNLVITGANTTYYNFGTNLSPQKGTVLSSSGPERIGVTFSSYLSAVGFEGYLNGLGPGTVKVLDGSTVIGTLNLPNPVGGGKIYVGILSDIKFNSFEWATTAGELRNTAIDTISVSTVPELPTALLMGIGITLLILRRMYLKPE